jgi:hypothetical protein
MSRKPRPTKPAKASRGPTRRPSRKSALKPAIRPRLSQVIQEPDLEPARWIAANAAIVIAAGVFACQN